MLNEHSRSIVTQSTYLNEFRLPCYDSYCFSNLPGTVAACFGEATLPKLPADVLPEAAATISSVVLVLFDAFGWYHFERARAAGVPFVHRCLEQGVVSALTSQFPSTTAAHLTTMYTGVPVGRSGILEWYTYIPSLENIILPLPWTDARTRVRESMSSTHSPDGIIPDSELYPALSAAGVRSAVIIRKDYAEGTFTRKVTPGAERCGFSNNPGAFRAAVDHTKAYLRSYASIYFDDLDHIAHQDGIESDRASNCIWQTFDLLESELLAPLSKSNERTLVLVTADHGGISVDPERCVYLDLVDPEMLELVARLPDGSPLAPVGGGRNLFVHAKPGMAADLRGRIHNILGKSAYVVPCSDLIARGLFGPPGQVRPDLAQRVGDMAVLPRSGFEVFWSLGGMYRRKDHGVHGGLSLTEVDIPLLALVV